jgi:hypothetical protein
MRNVVGTLNKFDQGLVSKIKLSRSGSSLALNSMENTSPVVSLQLATRTCGHCMPSLGTFIGGVFEGLGTLVVGVADVIATVVVGVFEIILLPFKVIFGAIDYAFQPAVVTVVHTHPAVGGAVAVRVGTTPVRAKVYQSPIQQPCQSASQSTCVSNNQNDGDVKVGNNDKDKSTTIKSESTVPAKIIVKKKNKKKKKKWYQCGTLGPAQDTSFASFLMMMLMLMPLVPMLISSKK